MRKTHRSRRAIDRRPRSRRSIVRGKHLHLLDNDISPSDSVRNLDVIFSFHKHVSNICKSCFYHIRDLHRIWCHIPLSTANSAKTI